MLHRAYITSARFQSLPRASRSGLEFVRLQRFASSGVNIFSGFRIVFSISFWKKECILPGGAAVLCLCARRSQLKGHLHSQQLLQAQSEGHLEISRRLRRFAWNSWVDCPCLPVLPAKALTGNRDSTFSYISRQIAGVHGERLR